MQWFHKSVDQLDGPSTHNIHLNAVQTEGLKGGFDLQHCTLRSEISTLQSQKGGWDGWWFYNVHSCQNPGFDSRLL